MLKRANTYQILRLHKILFNQEILVFIFNLEVDLTRFEIISVMVSCRILVFVSLPGTCTCY